MSSLTNEEYIRTVIETVITMWFHQFEIPKNLLETVTCEVTTEIKPLFDHPLMREETSKSNPTEFGMEIAKSWGPELDDGTPVDSGKIARYAILLASRGVLAEGISTALKGHLKRFLD